MFSRLIVDAHEDLAWNHLTFNRDYTRSALVTRMLEARTDTPAHNGQAMLGRTEWLLGHVGIIFATLFASPAHRRLGHWDVQCYATPAEAFTRYRQQLDYYLRLEDTSPTFQIIRTVKDLEEVLATWQPNISLGHRRIGLVVLMEGADGITEPEQAEYWMEHGVRAIGPAWTRTRYAGGTGDPGPLTADGLRLLRRMGELGLMLDLSHLTDEGVYQALDQFEGVLFASHSNPRDRVINSARPERYLADDQIRRIAERDGVIGLVPFNRMIDGLWTAADGKSRITIAEHFTAMIDHICQVTGSAAHVGIGSDFEGGFGADSTPAEIDTVADLDVVSHALTRRGYDSAAIDAILCNNWLRILRRGLPG